jgi:hypothetical protein
VNLGFEYIRKAYTMYLPRTPKSALRAVESGVVPPEAFIYLSANIKPLFEEPYDLGDIDRVLARPNLDLKTNLLLIKILEKLINHRDTEIALFAAESINAIENRYNIQIQSIKDEIRDLENGIEGEKKKLEYDDITYLLTQRTNLSRLYYEFALVNNSRDVLKKFYMKEAFRVLNPVISKQDQFAHYNIHDLVILGLRCLIVLEMYDHARKVLKESSTLKESYQSEFLMIELELEYYARNMDGFRQNILELAKISGDDPQFKQILRNWQNSAFEEVVHG